MTPVARPASSSWSSSPPATSARPLAWRHGSSAWRRSCGRAGRSSRPPSADPPAKRPQAKGSPSPRKQGGQPGHEGTTRKLAAESEVDLVIDDWPANCSGCGAGLDSSEREPAGAPHRHQVTEPAADRGHRHRAPRPRPALPRLRQLHPGRPAAGSPGKRFGPRLQAAIALLSVRNRISRPRRLRALRGAVRLAVSVGSVDAICERASGARASPPTPSGEAAEDAPVLFARRTGGATPGKSAPSGAPSPTPAPPSTSPPTAT